MAAATPLAPAASPVPAGLQWANRIGQQAGAARRSTAQAARTLAFIGEDAARSSAMLGDGEIETAPAGPGPAALVAAQRAAILQLALRIAAEAPAAAAP